MILNVKDYGAVGDGVTNDTVAIQNTYNALGAGTVYFPAGVYKVTDTINLGNYAITTKGDGKQASVVITNSAAADIFKVQSEYAVKFEDLAIDCSVARTAGNGIWFDGHGGGVNPRAQVTNVLLNNQWYALNFSNTVEFNTYNVDIYGCLKVGIFIRNSINADQGDSSITGGYISGNSNTFTYGILHWSSGGLRIVGVKVQYFQYGYLYDAHDGNTGNLQISASSFENQTVAAIGFYRGAGTYTFERIVIVGNQFGLYNGIYAIQGISDGFSQFVITGNAFQGNGTASGKNAIDLTYGNMGQISGNSFYNWNIGIKVASGAANLHWNGNAFKNVTTSVSNSSSTSSAN